MKKHINILVYNPYLPFPLSITSFFRVLCDFLPLPLLLVAVGDIFTLLCLLQQKLALSNQRKREFFLEGYGTVRTKEKAECGIGRNQVASGGPISRDCLTVLAGCC